VQTKHSFIFEDSRTINSLKNASVDLVVTSPPYPMIEMWDRQFAEMDPGIGLCLARGDSDGAFEAMHALLDQTWEELYRVMKNGAFACINIGDATRTVNGRFQLFANHSRVQSRFSELGFDVLPLILWRKQTNAPNKFMGSGMLPAGAYVTLEHEYILIFRKGPKREFKTAEEKHKRLLSSYFWEERNAWFSDLWDFKGARQGTGNLEPRERSGAFPLELPLRLINMYSLLEDTVLDPFAGTGTTTLASIAAGRNSIGLEIDPAFAGPVRSRVLGDSSKLNACNLERIKNHLEFVHAYNTDQGELKYTNSYFGFPVMTRQEKELKLAFVQSVKEEKKNCFRTTYFSDQYIQNIDPEQLDLGYLTYDQGVQSRLMFYD